MVFRSLSEAPGARGSGRQRVHARKGERVALSIAQDERTTLCAGEWERLAKARGPGLSA